MDDLLPVEECDHMTWMILLPVKECDHMTWMIPLPVKANRGITWNHLKNINLN
jgi:hypothetical protein